MTSDSDLLKLTEALVRLPTPNPPGEERPLAEFLAAELRARGLEAEVLPVTTHDAPQANVLARLPGHDPSRPALIFCGHLDTVPAGAGAWQRDPWQPVVEDGRLYGLGAADMKGAIAAMVVAATRLAAQARAGSLLPGDVLFAFTSGEETGSFGARALARSGRLAGGGGLVIGEPTGNRVAAAEKGGTWFDVVLRGRTAHGSLPHLGRNAVAGLGEFLLAVERALPPEEPLDAGRSGTGRGHADGGLTPAQLALRRTLRRPAHPLLGVPTLVPTLVQGGVGANVVPDHASATFDVRLLPGQTGESIREAVRHVAAEIARRRELAVELALRGDRAALETPVDHPLVLAGQAAVQAVTGEVAPVAPFTGATDASELVPSLDLPFVICGPGHMAQAHQPDEWVSLDLLVAAPAIYVEIARRFWA